MVAMKLGVEDGEVEEYLLDGDQVCLTSPVGISGRRRYAPFLCFDVVGENRSVFCSQWTQVSAVLLRGAEDNYI